MKLIIGLGNPGIRYAGTRHNAGRHLVESIAKREGGLKWVKKKSLQASVAQTQWDTEEVLLARPEVFMNLSGQAVLLLVTHAGIDVSKDLLIAVDDLALPFGKLRLRGRGSDGGHNGLKSISQLLGTTGFARLRMGIAPLESSKEIADTTAYVLESFHPKEKEALDSFFKKGSEACRLWALESLAAAMNAVNPDKP